MAPRARDALVWILRLHRMDFTYFKILWFRCLSLWILNLFLEKINWYFYVCVFVCIRLNWFFLALSLQRVESSPSSNTFQTSIDDSEDISDYENLEVTSAKDLFYGRGDRTEHCLSKCLKIKLSGTVKSTLSITFFGFIPKENTQGAS